MITKLAKLKAAWAAGDTRDALRIAAKFPRLGDDKAAITRAWNAHLRPDFYRQMGRDPEALVSAGVAALKSHYRL